MILELNDGETMVAIEAEEIFAVVRRDLAAASRSSLLASLLGASPGVDTDGVVEQKFYTSVEYGETSIVLKDPDGLIYSQVLATMREVQFEMED